VAPPCETSTALQPLLAARASENCSVIFSCVATFSNSSATAESPVRSTRVCPVGPRTRINCKHPSTRRRNEPVCRPASIAACRAEARHSDTTKRQSDGIKNKKHIVLCSPIRWSAPYPTVVCSYRHSDAINTVICTKFGLGCSSVAATKQNAVLPPNPTSTTLTCWLRGRPLLVHVVGLRPFERPQRTIGTRKTTMGVVAGRRQLWSYMKLDGHTRSRGSNEYATKASACTTNCVPDCTCGEE
jgi:hypothetical protein